MGVITGAVAAYLVGCVPAARVVSKLSGQQRWTPWAAAAADALKGFVAMMLFTPVTTLGQALTLTALVAGDQWPAFGGPPGRSGLWAAIGAMTRLTPVSPIVWLVLWAIGFTASGYFTVGIGVACLLLAPLLGRVAGVPYAVIVLPACIMLLERQREPLRSVRRGEEPKHHWRVDG